ncbi:hypothetical protein ACFL1X_07305 [Candidatus Hydrogenedentota bacterium]
MVDSGRLLTILPLLYLGAFLASAYAIYDREDLSRSYFRPSSIMVLYVSLFFFMGSFAFKNELVLMETASQFEYYSLEKFGVVSFYFLCAIGVTLISQVLSKHRSNTSPAHAHDAKRPGGKKLNTQGVRVLLSVIIIILTPLVDIPLPGGSGSFSSTFFMFAAVHIAYVAKLSGRKYRAGIYALLAFLLATSFYSDRRLLFYFAFILCFIEVFDKRPFKIRAKAFALLAAIFVSLITANIAMSIHRGVGEFESKSMSDAFTYVDDYLASDWAQTMLLHNFEGPPTIFHSYNAVNYMIRSGDYRHGLTFVKVFFLPIPRSVFPDKPRSMVDEYTTILYPVFRERGGSWVPNLYTEAFWNFGLFGGLFFLLVGYYCLDTIYFKWIGRLRAGARVENVFFLSSFAFLLFLFRGSGVDLYGLFVIIFFFMARMYGLLGLGRHVIRKETPPDACRDTVVDGKDLMGTLDK